LYKELVRKYIDKLSIQDIKMFANKNNISYTDEEVLIVYDFIKNNYNNLLEQDINVFLKIKGRIRPELYKQLINLYIEYKQKYL